MEETHRHVSHIKYLCSSYKERPLRYERKSFTFFQLHKVASVSETLENKT